MKSSWGLCASIIMQYIHGEWNFWTFVHLGANEQLLVHVWKQWQQEAMISALGVLKYPTFLSTNQLLYFPFEIKFYNFGRRDYQDYYKIHIWFCFWPHWPSTYSLLLQKADAVRLHDYKKGRLNASILINVSSNEISQHAECCLIFTNIERCTISGKVKFSSRIVKILL